MSLGARIYSNLRGDRVIWMVIILLSMISILGIYSATEGLAYKNANGDTEAYLFKHVVILFFGLFLSFMCYKMHYARYKNAAPWLMLVTIPLLVYTIAMGTDINNARRWVEIPFIGITFQSSDLAKLALILFVAREVTRHKDYIKEFEKAFLPIILPILIIVGLIAPADLSTALLLFTTCLMMMFVGRVNWKYIFLTIFLGVVVFACLIILAEFFPDFIRLDTWVSRIREYLNNVEGPDQIQHAKIAIANGGIMGVGPGQSIMNNYLYAASADFIYAIICEEYGIIGGGIVLSLYVLLFFRAVRLVTKSDKSFGAMAALGISLMLVLQALANMAVSVHLVPVTGLTMPLVSMGGTSLLFTCISFGIILSVSKYIEGGVIDTSVAKGGGEKKATEEKQEDKGEQKDGGKPKDSGGNSGGGGHNRSGGGNRNNNRGGGNRNYNNRSGGNRNHNNRGGGNRNHGGGNRNNNNRGGGGNKGGGNRN